MDSLPARVALPLAIAILVTGCGLFRPDLADAAIEHGIERPTLVEITSTEGVGLRRSSGEIELVRLVPDGASWAEFVLATGPAAKTLTVQFAAGEEESADPTAYLFGNAPADVAQVEVQVPPPEGRDEPVGVEGGTVANGLWLVVIHAAAADPSGITWRMRDASGRIVEEGTGPTS